MSVNLSNFSIVSWFEDVEKHRCGYCKSENSSISNGMWAEQLTVYDYQDLIDRGWRRSGKYCYKPIINETCCPQYTIRCAASNISLSKSQKKIIKKFNRFLEDGILNKNDIPTEGFATHDSTQEKILQKATPNIILGQIRCNYDETQQSKGEEHIDHGTGEPCHTRSGTTAKNIIKCDTPEMEDKFKQKEINSNKINNQGLGLDCLKPPHKKAKLLRIERKKEKLNKIGLKFEDIGKKKPEAKSIEEFIENISNNCKLKFKMRLFSCSELRHNTLQEEYSLYEKYQMKIHNDPPEKLSLYRFKRFLVTSPLKEANFPNGDGPGFGSFHQQYWLDDKLIAVGVIDILPRCVSSVYFFYDPEYTSLSLGTYSSLREVYFTRSLQKQLPELCYYYMGFYIHTCLKMRYKGKLMPSYLLCPETYCWIPIQKTISLLDLNKYSRLNSDANAVDVNKPTDDDFTETKIVYDHQFMSLASYRIMSSTSNSLFNQIGLLVGRTCLRNMVFWIQ